MKNKMDSIRLMTYFLMSMITLDLNLAESANSNIAAMMRPVFRKFEWRNLNGAPVEYGTEDKSVSIESDDDTDRTNPRAVYWIPTNCDPAVERGYTCVGCGESLHCMGGGFALKAVCWGRRPYCKNGVCGSTKGEKCDKINDDVANAGVMEGSGVFPDDDVAVTHEDIPIKDEKVAANADITTTSNL